MYISEDLNKMDKSYDNFNLSKMLLICIFLSHFIFNDMNLVSVTIFFSHHKQNNNHLHSSHTKTQLKKHKFQLIFKLKRNSFEPKKNSWVIFSCGEKARTKNAGLVQKYHKNAE